MSKPYLVSMSPHMHSDTTIQRIMMDVIIALLPATIFGVYNFGLKALIITLLSIASCVASEFVFQIVTKRKSTIMDLSAVVTGLLLAMNLPYTVKWYIPVIGGVFAIIIVKQVFGGLGQNFMNPALGARAFLLVSFAGQMTRWTLDAVSSATPLMILKDNTGTAVTELVSSGQLPEMFRAFSGSILGCIGETSALALLLGGIYLMVRKVISWRIPTFYIGSFFVLMFVLQGFDLQVTSYHVLSGGLFLGAFFMATDYATSPNSKVGQVIMGIGCAVLTVVIRLYGGYPEGVSFAILIMNLFVPLIDRYTIPKAFGEVKA